MLLMPLKDFNQIKIFFGGGFNEGVSQRKCLKQILSTYFLAKLSLGICIMIWRSIWPTVGENIIATIKMRNNFCYPLKMVIWTFLYCSPFSYPSSNFPIAKVVALNLFASILYKICRLIHGFFSVLLPI